MNRKHTLIKSLSLLLALLFLIPTGIFAEESEAERYILLPDEGFSGEALAKVMREDGIEVVYIYDRLLDGICISTDKTQEELAAYEGVGRVLIPQIYTLLAKEPASEGGFLTDEEAAADARHAAAAIETAEGADGAGTVVAILDGGFNAAAKHLSLTDTESAKLTESTVLGLRSSLCADQLGYIYWKDAWLRYKVPFAYDYAEGDLDVSDTDTTHGDHVAAIIAANGKMKGAAPEAQLLMMKVALSYMGISLAEEGDILAALEDSAILGADVICLPFGAPMLTGEDGTPGYALSLALDAANEEGISIVAAAGNDGERENALASSPDTATLHGFAAQKSVTAAASSEYFMRTMPCLATSEGFRFLFTDTSEDVSGISFTDAFDGRELALVSVPGLGMPEDFEGLALEGRLALIARGEIPFADKVNNAEAAGAVGVIVYNNEADAALANMQLDYGSIPAVFVSLETGEKLKGADAIVISSDAYMQVEVEGGGLVSSFSSRGNGIAMPDLTAFGSSLTPPDAMTVYDTVEGSSFSAALTAGYTAALLSYRRANGGDTSPAGLRTAFMNSASVIELEEVPLSPRSQGAGRISLAGAIESSLILTTENGEAAHLPGNIKERSSFRLKLTNTDSRARTLTVTAAPTTSDAFSYIYDEESGMLLPSERSDGSYPYYTGSYQQALSEASLTLNGCELNRYHENHTPAAIKLEAGETVTLAITLDLSAVKLSELFENGYFAEGYIEIAEDGEPAAGLPFCGFVGEREKLPIIGEITLNAYSANAYLFAEWQMGVNAFGDMESAKKASFSPNRDGSYEYATLNMELLRDADRFYYELLTGDDEPIYRSWEYVDLHSAAAAGYVAVDVWDGSDPENDRYVYPDGDYTLRIHLFDGDAEHVIDRIITIDTAKPAVENISLTYDTLTCTLRDSGGIQYACAYAMDEYGFYHSFYTDFVLPSEDCTEYTHTFDLTGLEESAEWLYVEVCDYAFNIKTIRVPLSEAAE